MASSKAFHRIVAPASVFDRLSNEEWLTTSYERFKQLGLSDYGPLLLSLLPQSQFEQLDRAVASILKAAGTPRAAEWVAINILDGRFALIQIAEMSIACYREDVVPPCSIEPPRRWLKRTMSKAGTSV